MSISRRNFVILAASSTLPVAALAQDSAKASPLERVDAKYVCFVTKHRFDKEQLPVAVEGKTYYGCCGMCKAKLTEDAAQRCDVDPVSGAKVDKATAVIGADSKGNVYFFENEENLKKYKPATDTK
jgi:YHS domain-containing protein